jgi:acetyl esterase/lipase
LLSNLDIANLPKVKSISNLYGVNDRQTWIEDGFPSAKLFTKMYLDNTDAIDIPIVPMEFEKIENLPPSFVAGAGKDKLLRSSKIWAERISKQFNNVQFKVYEGADHGFFSSGKGSDELIDDILQFISNAEKS